MKKDKLIKKIKKLLAKGRDKTVTQEESQSFLSKAYSMMIENQIEESEVKSDDNEFKIENIPLNPNDKGKRGIRIWKKTLASLMAKTFGICVFSSGPFIFMSGREEDMKQARTLWDLCYKEINNLTPKFSKGKGIHYADSFRVGFIYGINGAIEQEKERLRKKYKQEQAENSKYALMVLDNSLVKRRTDEISEWMKKEEKLKEAAPAPEFKPHPEAFAYGKLNGHKVYANNKS